MSFCFLHAGKLLIAHLKIVQEMYAGKLQSTEKIFQTDFGAVQCPFFTYMDGR